MQKHIMPSLHKLKRDEHLNVDYVSSHNLTRATN